ncbi:MAG: YXWGXW repeat-containing protein [Reyranellales bacterium]
MMKLRLSTLLAAALTSAPAMVAPAMLSPAAAQVEYSFTVNVPPPTPLFEAVPAPRPGYAWAPGYWRWENNRHVWGPGRWIEAPHGERWVADRWDHRDGARGGWHYEPGHFDRGHERQSFDEHRIP